MKLIISTFIIFLISFKFFGQLNYGIKAGISLNASGDITSASSDLSSLALINENKNGYFFGGYASLNCFFCICVLNYNFLILIVRLNQFL